MGCRDGVGHALRAFSQLQHSVHDFIQHVPKGSMLLVEVIKAMYASVFGNSTAQGCRLVRR
jgi:hypothetical protein